MALQFSTDVRAARVQSIESAIGASPTLEIRTLAPPANPAAADAGTVLATMTLPSDWLTNPGTGAVGINGTWQDLSADAAGTAAHFRIKAGGNCKIQGTISATGGGGDMTLDNIVLALGQRVDITSFSLTDGNA